jgi:dUTPase
MIKIGLPYKVKVFDMSSLAHHDGQSRYCVMGPGIDSDYRGTFPRSLKGMSYEDATELANFLNVAYKNGQLQRSHEVRKMFQDLVGLD